MENVTKVGGGGGGQGSCRMPNDERLEGYLRNDGEDDPLDGVPAEGKVVEDVVENVGRHGERAWWSWFMGEGVWGKECGGALNEWTGRRRFRRPMIEIFLT